MYLNDEEDEKVSDPFTCDDRLYDSLRTLFEQRGEEICKVYS